MRGEHLDFRIGTPQTHCQFVRMSDFDDRATANHGLIVRDASGLSESAWRRALDAGRFEQLHPGVARLPGTPRTPLQRIAAAVLAAGTGALASHRSAAYLWGVVAPTRSPVDLIIPGRRRHPRLSDVAVHRPSDSLRLIPQRRSGVPCTNILRTLCDLGAVDPEAVGSAVGQALSVGLASLGALEQTVFEHARCGRAGVVALRGAIDEWSIDCKPADSALEAAMARLAHRYGLPPMEFHPRICGWEVDFRFSGTAVLLECDGWTTHGLDRGQFERDRRKDDDLHAAGWIVVRFTYRAVVGRPADTARRLDRLVRRWADLPAPDAR